MGRMKFFYDTEFIENGRTIELISIGIVCEDGREYYAVNWHAPWRRIRRHKWLMANVVPSLPQGYGDRRLTIPSRWLFDYGDPRVKSPARIAEEVEDFLLGPLADKPNDVELWAWYGAYDHVALAQLFGPMVDLPTGIPMWTHDLNAEIANHGQAESDLPQQRVGLHNALDDARHVRYLYHYLNRTPEASHV